MRKLLVVLAATFGVLWLGVPAHADPAGDAVNAFKSGKHLYIEPGSGFTVNEAAVTQAIGDRPIYYVVVKNEDAGGLASQIGHELSVPPLVAVLSHDNQRFRTASPLFCANALDAPTRDAPAENSADLKAGNATTLLVGFAERFDSIPKPPNCPASSNGGGAASTTAQEKNSGGSNGGAILAGILGVGALGGGAYALSRRRKKQRELADLRAEVVSLYDRLGADVSNIDPKDDTVARQALADASERYTAAGSQLAGADSPAKFATARRTALEGLYAARTAREKLGLSLGPDLPPIYQTTGNTLSEPTTVTVKGQEVQGYPQYQPGAPYYYGGGGGYGAGWYSMPFWETLLLTSVLTGGIGGFGGGWGGGGFDSGYRDGYQDAQQDSGGGDPGWGGGDSGGGGGGWDIGGDSGGGGDWGGGGGDFGQKRLEDEIVVVVDQLDVELVAAAACTGSPPTR